ncbi:MAG: two-component system, OmpR family, alkaline phosphatase synthesis response regulator PhoP [Halanaerobium sp. 4-GBenrich]|jgi:two-component system alkaline phosphatase synthesis response regulator PhoP|uniref:Stage 0 sporulation protein A homolog n=1 Tax=Halanaerobium congolense TaxID=54121 RepID=A0A1G6LMM5_9FIRM|nr:response regulator transcription factor [Halanaerobium congolense]KXS49796.1 MAG: two-component system, OmpR family, alkaline phosphatase synthesis response regulator PhoP [Halanaerobium sp. T82-1]ODS50644.1 MAG: two-component system, OmpR family, alkaline phosphatase synthesis response regulator PhoP [Halanaerobium sp. 4-GBenrich]PUU93126.1 MAG: two-component system, OmpR family, alkaline phosphatase synthesis response regulator PhoP [Halanaerobium sp.]PTX15661.1 two-component system alkali
MDKILVVEDEKNIRELIKFNVENAGYEVETAADGKEAMAKLSEEIDLVVLDLMLPEIDGMEVCRRMRSSEELRQIPIIMLTAKGEEVERILGLEMGADDYMTKPFSPRELVARIKAIFRRIKEYRADDEKIKDEIIEVGKIKIDISRHEVIYEGQKIILTPKEFELLRYLIINQGRVLSRDLLLEKIWGYEYAGDTRTVDVHIRRIRKKLNSDYIATVRGVGYKFVKME